MDDRIKLAEAMGWKHTAPSEGGITDKKLWHWEIRDPDKRIAWYPHELPDPENDANDDYAVLEWMRQTYEHNSKERMLFGIYLAEQFGVTKEKLNFLNYQIGDYARAALKVINQPTT